MPTPVSFKAYRASWRKLYKQATREDKRLCCGVVLTACRRTQLNPLYSTLSSPDKLPQTHPPIEPPRPRADVDLPILGQPVTLQLTRALQGSNEFWSQTWLVEVPTNKGTPLVLKLFQESLFSSPTRSSFVDYEEWCADAQSAKEAWAFGEMKPLQGTIIPHSYGFYDFELPCGEVVCGHLMEYVEGEEIYRDFALMPSDEWENEERQLERQLPMEQLTASVYAMHCYGVHHGDLRSRNVLRLRDNPNHFVVIDFGRSSPLSNQSDYGASDRRQLVKCLTLFDSCERVVRWIERKLAENDPMVALWTTRGALDTLKLTAPLLEWKYVRRAQQWAEYNGEPLWSEESDLDRD